MREMGAWELGQALESTLLPQLRRKPYRQSPGESTQQGLIWGEVCGQNEMGRQGAVTRRCCEVKASKQQGRAQVCRDSAVWGPSCVGIQLCRDPAGRPRCVGTQLGEGGGQACGDPAGVAQVCRAPGVRGPSWGAQVCGEVATCWLHLCILHSMGPLP